MVHLSDSDDDVVMPAGPPPGAEIEEDEDSDNDIPMPAGPPPGQSLPPGLFVKFWYICFETDVCKS